jgi:Flp pilus assembly protein TadB
LKKNALIILGIIIIAIIGYVTFIVAAIKVIVGAILMLITAVIVWLLWRKLKNKFD